MQGVVEGIQSRTQRLRRAIRNQPKTKDIFVAIKNYDSHASKSRLTIKKDDEFRLKSDMDSNWWLVKRKESGEVGYAPSTFLMRPSDDQNCRWISLGETKRSAGKTLMDTNLKSGSFIIRENEGRSISHSLVLSVKLPKPTDHDKFIIAHFPIVRDGTAFRIGKKKGDSPFESLTKLVEMYSDRNPSDLLLTYSVKKRVQYHTRWEYDSSVIKKGRHIGGSFGDVYKGFIYRKEVALKILKNANVTVEEFMKEADIAKHCSHPNVHVTFGVCKNEIEPYIITEFLKNGSLKDYMSKNLDNPFTPGQCRAISRNVASGMEYLSIKGIVHRDLATRNILMGKTIDTIKVADFGLARNLNESRYYYSEKEVFPQKWTAPEGFVFLDGIFTLQRGKVTSAADVWSFAVVMWELYSNGQEPYRGVETKDIHKKLTEDDNYRLLKPDTCPEEIYAKMFTCWNIVPTARPSFSDLRVFLSVLSNEPCACKQQEEEDDRPTGFSLNAFAAR